MVRRRRLRKLVSTQALAGAVDQPTGRSWVLVGSRRTRTLHGPIADCLPKRSGNGQFEELMVEGPLGATSYMTPIGYILSAKRFARVLSVTLWGDRRFATMTSVFVGHLVDI